MFPRNTSISHYEYSRLMMISQFLVANKPVAPDHFTNHYRHTYAHAIPHFDWTKTYTELKELTQDKIFQLDFRKSSDTSSLSLSLRNNLDSAIHARFFEFFDGLHSCIQQNDLPIADNMIDYILSNTIYHYSAKEFEELLDCLNVDINRALSVENIDSSTPPCVQLSILHCAIRAGNRGVVELLLEKNADVHALSENNLTALEEAEKRLQALNPNTPCLSLIPDIYHLLRDHEEKRAASKPSA